MSELSATRNTTASDHQTCPLQVATCKHEQFCLCQVSRAVHELVHDFPIIFAELSGLKS
jgi:hypothetical protein